MNRSSLLCPLLLAIPLMTFAQSPEPIPLWPGGAPGALGKGENDIPTLTPYVVDGTNRTRAGIVVCPGGAYGGLAPHEGRDYALWLNQHGISAFVLKYRLGTHGYRHPAMIEDAARALRTVRARAGDWDLDPDRIGIMGSSAGGHLASTLLTHFEDGDRDSLDPIERVSSRPDLGILCYPVITMGPDTHTGSRNNLLGRDPDPELIALLSNERQVTDRTPPCFIWHTWEDKGVKAVNSLEFAAALNRAGVPFDLHVFEQGRHGIGLADSPPFDKAHPWAGNLLFWLKARGFLD